MLKPFTFEPIGIAAPANDPLLVNWLNNFLISFKGSGELKRITDYWLDNDEWVKRLPEINLSGRHNLYQNIFLFLK